MTPPPPQRRKTTLSSPESPRPPRRPVPVPSPAEPESAWTEAKAILDAFRSFIGNAAKKPQVVASEVAALVRDHL